MRNTFKLDFRRFTSVAAIKTPMHTFSFIGLLLVLILCCEKYANAQSKPTTNASPQWWFNVELIAFKRTMLPTNTEDFSQANFEINYANSNQLLYLAALTNANPFAAYINGLEQCEGTLAPSLVNDVILDFEVNIDESVHINESATIDESVHSDSSVLNGSTQFEEVLDNSEIFPNTEDLLVK